MDERRLKYLFEMLAADADTSKELREDAARAVIRAREAVARSLALRAQLAKETASPGWRDDESPARP